MIAHRVVLTGIGIYSCIGKNVDECRDSLYKGKSGIIFDAARKKAGFRSALTGMVQRPELKDALDRKLRVNLAEQGEYAYVAADEALQFPAVGQFPRLDCLILTTRRRELPIR